MELNRVTIEDYESIIAFYDDVTDRTPDMEQYARWKKGLHPTHDGVRAYIEEGSMYTYKENDVIIGAMAVTMYQGEDYHAIYAENTGWTDFYFFEYNEVTHIRFIEKEKWDEALKLVKNASPYGHGFYKKLGFVDTSEEQITNGVRYYPMKK